MADVIVRDNRVLWGPAITGAFFAVACALVLGFFGLSFAAGGNMALAAVWLILTPLAATFIGAAVATGIAGHVNYATGLMVWCISLVVQALFAPAGLAQIGVSGTSLALMGLSALLGLCGALAGTAVGSNVYARAGIAPGRTRSDFRQQPVYPSMKQETTEPPELRH